MKSTESFDDSHAITIPNAVAGGSSRVLRQGDVIGGTYKLKSLLGRGGMGYVFCAEHIVLNIDYALKMLAPEQLNDISRRRFDVEARSIANLDHINIVKVHNMGLDSGDCPFYVMDLLEGKSLADCIDDGEQFSVDNILDIFIQIAEGLSYAHGKGLVHRDIKPSNIILLRERRGLRVKIVDFGIAKLLPSADLHTQSQTATGEVFGSPYYMSPEQGMGGKIDECSDMYSLGCTLYEAIVGLPPFRGENPMQTIMMHQNAEVPSVRLSPQGANFPPAMDQLLLKMMAKRPADRYQSMRQFIHDLERLAQGKSIGVGAVTAGGFSGERAQANLYRSGAESGDARARAAPQGSQIIWACGAILVLVFALVGLYYVGALGGRTGGAKPMAKSTSATSSTAALHVEAKNIKDIEGGPTNDLLGNDELGRDSRLKSADALFNKVVNSDVAKSLTQTTEELPAWKKIVAQCPPVVSRQVMVNGERKRRFVFPARSIGKIFCQEEDRFEQFDARGVVLAPCKPLSLAVGYKSGHFIFTLPELLKKVGKDEFVGLLINGQNVNPKSSIAQHLGAECDGASEMVKTAAHWPNLKRLMLSKIVVSAFLVNDLNLLPGLNQLEIYHCRLNMENFVKQPFLLRLHMLLLDGYTDLKPLLQKLSLNPYLRCLKLFNCSVQPEDLRTISTYPKLESLQLCEEDITNLLPEVHKLTRLKSILIGGPRLTMAQIHGLTSMPGLNEVILGAELYPNKADVEYILDHEKKVKMIPFD